MGELYDVTIIGGGTTGLFTAFYSGMRDMKTKIIESGETFGGKVTQFFPEKLIYDIGGIPGITGDDLVKQMSEQASQHDPTIVSNEWIEKVSKLKDGTFALTSQKGNQHLSKTVIITTGMGTFEVLGPELAAVDRYKGTSLHYSISEQGRFTDQVVLISSNNRVGIEWALKLESIAEKVYLINNDDKFQHATDEELTRLGQSAVDVKLASTIKELNGNDTRIQEVILDDLDRIKVEHVLVYNGVKLTPTPFQNWGLSTEKGRVIVNANMATDIEGVFAAGDATIYSGKTMLIASGYTEAITAANSAKKYINPKASPQVYSTVIYRDQ